MPYEPIQSTVATGAAAIILIDEQRTDFEGRHASEGQSNTRYLTWKQFVALAGAEFDWVCFAKGEMLRTAMGAHASSAVFTHRLPVGCTCHHLRVLVTSKSG